MLSRSDWRKTASRGFNVGAREEASPSDALGEWMETCVWSPFPSVGAGCKCSEAKKEETILYICVRKSRAQTSLDAGNRSPSRV